MRYAMERRPGRMLRRVRLFQRRRSVDVADATRQQLSGSAGRRRSHLLSLHPPKRLHLSSNQFN